MLAMLFYSPLQGQPSANTARHLDPVQTPARQGNFSVALEAEAETVSAHPTRLLLQRHLGSLRATAPSEGDCALFVQAVLACAASARKAKIEGGRTKKLATGIGSQQQEK